jgi:PAS domain S-box-containing protein
MAENDHITPDNVMAGKASGFPEPLKYLPANEERYHRMIEEVKDYAIIYLSPEGIIENWNKGAQQIKGYEPPEIIGKNFSIFYTDEDLLDGLPARLLQVAQQEGRATHEGWRRRKDGSLFWGNILITALYNERKQLTGYTKITRDLTDKKRADDQLKAVLEQLAKSENLYHRMVDEVQDYAILYLSPDGIIENWNKGAERIKGYKAAEIIGKNFSVFYTAKDRESGLPEILLQVASREGRANHEGWRKRKDGSLFWGNILITALYNENNQLTGFTKITRDLTDKKRSDDEIRTHAQKLEEKNRELEKINGELKLFTYVSSHDLQEPLRKIQTFCSRITEHKHELPEVSLDYFERIQRSANRMQKLIIDLLAYANTNLSESMFSNTDLMQVLEEVKSELHDRIREKHAVIEAADLGRINAIPFQVHQLLYNLVSNSLKFAQKDIPSHISITRSQVQGKDIPAANLQPDAIYHHIRISDNGIGFDPKYTEKIFTVFQRLHAKHEYEGTGIGLAIVKKIVENHHGFITADSTPGTGTVFNIYLPEEQ